MAATTMVMPALEDMNQATIVDWLARGDAFGGAAPRRIDTHAAHIFLTADRAWKLKRAVTLPYLDFATPEKRRDALAAELTLNRRTAPHLYLRLVPVCRDDNGAPVLDGSGDPRDWLLEMKRFPDDALLAQADGFETADLMALADRIAALHGLAEPVASDGAARIRRVIDGNVESFARVSGMFDPGALLALEDAQRAELAAHAGRLDARAAAGRVRRGHGDLHLGNIAMIDGAPTPFDCLEFSDELATTDVLYDLAFLLMDLIRRGHETAASIVVNRYCDVAAQGATGFALLPLFISIRAAIRAHVSAAAGERDEANAYLALARAALAPAPPRLIAVAGLSGSGKSTLARKAAPHAGRMPGARVLRSDVFRKRLAGVAPETRLAPASYTARSNAETYEALLESAEDHLRCGNAVILDAVYASRSERDVTEFLAERERVPFTGIWLDAPDAWRIARVEDRRGDASDATAQVARDQSRRPVGELSHWHRIRANRPLDRIVAAARAILERAPR